jgi:DNA-binding transcriptional MerR regulator
VSKIGRRYTHEQIITILREAEVMQYQGMNIAEVIQEGEMPPSYFVMLQPDARLTGAEQEALIRGLMATTGGSAGSD